MALHGSNMLDRAQERMVAAYSEDAPQGWSKKDIMMAVAFSVAIAANVAFIALTVLPIPGSATFALFYTGFAIWSQLSNIGLATVALLTVIYKNCENYPRLRNFIQPLTL